MRSKEEAHDYRYFPEPDLIPLHLDPKWIESIKASLPELPEQKRNRYLTEYGLSAYDAGVLTSSKDLNAIFEATLTEHGDSKAAAKPASNLITGVVARLTNETGMEVTESKLKASHLAEVIKLTQKNEVSSTGAKTIITKAWESGDSVSTIVDREGLKQVSDLSSLEPAIDQVIAANPSQVADFKAGKDKLLGFFVGQVMKATGGKANPGLLGDLIRKKLSS
jgi:aspartyl-tRNA(Asn)/glutamyl-tRNA(Gln) amidotransferase subunit B